MAMKKILYHFGVFAAIALAFASCATEDEQKLPEGIYKHTATVTIGKTEDTKTAVVINGNKASYVWTENDENYLHVFENGLEGTITKATYSADFKTVTLEVSFDPTDPPTAPYTYAAKYYNEASGSFNPLIQASQNPKTDSFDPAADVLVSKEIVDNSTRLTELDFTMGRVVTVNKMTLTGLENNEVVEKVEFTLDKTMVARISYDTASSSYKYTSVSGGGTKITLNYTATTGAVPDGGEFPVYFVSAPVDAAGIVSVVVATDKNVYTKTNTLNPNPFSGKSITFEVGKFKTFTMGLAGFGAPKTSATDYTLVSAATGLPAEGKQANIIIVNGTNAMGVQNQNNRGVVTVPAAVNNVISLDNSSTAHIFTLAHTTDGYLISDNDDNTYLYAAGTKASGTNYLRSTATIDESCYWTITYDEGVATVQSVNNDKTPYMRYNSTNSLFSCYASATGQAAVSIYLDEDSIENIPVKQDVTLSFEPSNPADINLGDSFTEPTLTKSPSEAPVTYSVVTDPDGIATIDAATGELTITGAGEITVTATVSDLTHYNSASASYTLTVIDPNVVDYVTLDWTYPTSGSATSAGISAIDGVTVNGLGTDYGDNNAPYCIKFDNTDDYIQVKTDAAIGEVSVSYKMIGGNSASTLNILESEDGNTWNSVEDLAISGAQNSIGVVTTSNAFDSASRYVKINFTKGSNIGIGSITITKVDETPRFTVDSPLAATVAADDYTVDIHRKYFTGAITVTVPTECTWITAGSVAENANTLSIHVDANPGVARTATLTLSATGLESQSLVVNQAGNEPGTEGNPYTVAQAISAAGKLSQGGQSSSEVYITGIISTVTSYSSTYKSITYYISDDGTTTDEFEVYSGKGLNGADFAAITDLAVGDKVTVKGYLKNYSGTLEVYQNNQIVAFISQATRYTVTYSDDGNGSVSGPTSVGAQGSVTVTITPNSGYELNALTVGETNVTSSVSDGKYTFEMPASNVNVAATFKVKTTPGGTAAFSPSNFSGQGTSGSGSDITATVDGITFACNKGYGTTQIRCYSGGKITISAESGKTITAISFTFSSSSYTGGLETSYTSLSTSSWEKTLSSQARITAVTVTYE